MQKEEITVETRNNMTNREGNFGPEVVHYRRTEEIYVEMGERGKMKKANLRLYKESESTEGDDGTAKENYTSGQPITFEKLLEVSGTNGRWKILIIVLCAFSGFPVPMNAMSYQFLGATPEHWCHLEPLTDANWTTEQILSLAIPKRNGSSQYDGCNMYDYNYTSAAEMGYEKAMLNLERLGNSGDVKIVPCSKRDFNHSEEESSVVTEWDLVCDRRVLYSTTASVNQIGLLVGNGIFGYLIDAIGRRRSVLWSSFLTVILNLMAAGSPTLETYIIFRFLIQATEAGVYMSCFVLAMELCSVHERTHLGGLFPIPWALGYMALPSICLLVQKWRKLQVALSVPAFFFLAYFWLLPESPRWLILRGKYAEALKVLKWAATFNRKWLPPDGQLYSAMQDIEFEESHLIEIQEKKEPMSCLEEIKVILRHCTIVFQVPGVRGRAGMIFFVWTFGTMIYYGLGLNANNLSVDPYMYIFLGGVMEIVAYISLWLILMYTGRRNTLAILFLVCSVSVSTVGILMFNSPGVPTNAIISLSLCGKLSSTASHHLIWLMTAELFPTKYRPLVIGQAGVFGRAGSTCSTYINDILGRAAIWAPSALFGVASLTSAILAIFLPETKDTHLQETNKFHK
ncbi:organic cation transporter protein-like [Macrobrachium nipponense]|uniref:organic cation transporter protein-like n=1 Tax=Macrobrachium nipponense TaxID=159736 RepID=UPI0030C8B49D